jgi:WD40 repeat protein
MENLKYDALSAGAVTSAQFSADGKTVMAASDDWTARLWNCKVCRPVNEIAVELERAVGRELTEDEPRRFGMKGTSFLSSFSLFSK